MNIIHKKWTLSNAVYSLLLACQGLFGYNQNMSKKRWARPVSIRATLERFMRRIGKPEQRQLIELWRHWHMVMGDEIASLAWPLGSKNQVLMVGGEDALSLQEISFMHDDILERANAFMGNEYFRTVKTSLSLDRTPLDAACQIQTTQQVELFTPVELNGKLLELMPKMHPVAQCYARYVRKNKEK